jgi:glycosyltransferase involved in cell wall biosynthesis
VEEKVNGVTLMHFPKYKLKGMSLPDSFKVWLDQVAATEKDFIFHLHSVFFLPNYSVAQDLKKRNLPYIHTPHDSYTDESMRSNRLLKRLFIKAFDKSVMDGAKAVHAITKDGANSIAKYTSNPNIKLITNFVPKSPQVVGVKIKKQLCFVGRMDIYQKGIDTMLEAFSEFVKLSPDVSFVMVGGYQEEELEEFKKLIHKHHLTSDQVKLMGRVPSEDKYRILSESYAYFQLSRFEGFGLSIVEALSMAKPVIITDRVPIHDVILKYEAGLVGNNVKEALAILNRIFSLTQVQYAQMSANAYKCYQDNFNPQTVTKQLIEMYQVSL